MPKPTAPKPRTSLLDASIGGYVLRPEAKAAIRTMAAGAVRLDNRRRAILGQAGSSPLAVALVAAGAAPPSVLTNGGGQRPASGATGATSRSPKRSAPASPLRAAVRELLDRSGQTMSDNAGYYADRMREKIQDGQKWVHERPKVLRENLDYYAPGFRDYLDMVSKVDMTDTSMLTPEQIRLREKARAEARARRPALKTYALEYDANTGQLMPRYYPVPSDFPQFAPEPKAAYEERVSDSDMADVMNGDIYKRGTGHLVRVIDGPAEGRWMPTKLVEQVGGAYFDPYTEVYARAPGDAEARATYVRRSADTLAERKALIAGVDRDYEAVDPVQASGRAYLRGIPDGWLTNGTFPVTMALERTLTGHGEFLPNLAAENHIVALDKRNHPYWRGAGELTGAIIPGLSAGNKFKEAGKGAMFAVNAAQDFGLNAAGGYAAAYGSGDSDDVLGQAAFDAAVGRAAPEAVKFAGDRVGAVARRFSNYDAAAERAFDRYGKPAAALSEGVAKYFSQKALDDLLFPPNEPPPR